MEAVVGLGGGGEEGHPVKGCLGRATSSRLIVSREELIKRLRPEVG